MTRCTVHETRRTVVLMDGKMQIRHLQTTCHLRPYQSEALTAVRDAYLAGKRRVIVSLPTGTGKTVVFAQQENIGIEDEPFVEIHLRLPPRHCLKSATPSSSEIPFA
jgi:Type III restriction enzyme, res subunit